MTQPTDGSTYSRVLLHLLHLLERVEALEARPAPSSLVLAADHVFEVTKMFPTPEAAPAAVAIDWASVSAPSSLVLAADHVFEVTKMFPTPEAAPAAVAIDWASVSAPTPPAPAPAVVPVAVSERLPDPRPESYGGHCDAEGRCWVFMPPRATPFPNWTLLWIGHMQPYHSHWLPASAIPLPQGGEGEG